jgi:hypothetical protein
VDGGGVEYSVCVGVGFHLKDWLEKRRTGCRRRNAITGRELLRVSLQPAVHMETANVDSTPCFTFLSLDYGVLHLFCTLAPVLPTILTCPQQQTSSIPATLKALKTFSDASASSIIITTRPNERGNSLVLSWPASYISQTVRTVRPIRSSNNA